MKSLAGLAVFVIGIVLLVFGYNESRTFSSDISRFFTGNPNDRAVWLLALGALSVVAGIFLSVRASRRI